MTTNALATTVDRMTNLSNMLEARRTRIEQVIPAAMAGFTPSRAIAVVIDACARTPKLLECDPKTIVRAAIQAAEVGLELGSPLGEAYLVPFYNSKRKCKEAQFIPGYKGLIKLMSLDSRVSHVESTVVHAGDVFEWERGTSPKIVHKPGIGTKRLRGDVVAAYAVIHYVHGMAAFEVMDLDELTKLRDEGREKDQYKSGPWWNHTLEMYRKCPIRRLAKTARVSLHDHSLLSRAIEADEMADLGAAGKLAPEGFKGARAAEMRAMLGAGDSRVVVDAEEVSE